MILITGSTGFLGGVIGEYLEANSFIVRKGSRKKINNEYFKLDITDNEQVKRSCENIETSVFEGVLFCTQNLIRWLFFKRFKTKSNCTEHQCFLEVVTLTNGPSLKLHESGRV